MAKKVLVRIDSRLVHGQVVTRWIQRTDANRIIIIDDKLAQDSFMSQVYIMAAPPNIKVDIFSAKDAIGNWNKNTNDRIIFLFKNVETAINAYNDGFEIDALQVGGIGGAPGRKVVYKNITLSNEDFDQLEGISKNGVNITFQTVPDDKEITLAYVKEKFFK